MLMAGPIMGAKADDRRSVSIEKLLDWSYRTELTKASILGWTYNPLSRLWDYGSPIDNSRPSGSGTYYASVWEDAGTPHEDALLVHETVSELDSLRDDWHEQNDTEVLLGDMPEEVQRAAAGVVRDYKTSRTATVVTHAKIGARPLWKCDTPELKPTTGANGRPLWVVSREIISTGAFGAVHTQLVEEPCSYSKKKALPPNARMKMEWDPSLRSVVTRRADYCHWYASLTWLADELGGKLLTWSPTPPVCAALPWLEGETREPRVLPTLERAA